MDDFKKDVQNAHIAEIVARLNKQDIEAAGSILSHLPFERTVDVFDRPT